MATEHQTEAPHIVHDPLERGQIRILEVAAGDMDDPLVGVLLLAGFHDDFIKYDALSSRQYIDQFFAWVKTTCLCPAFLRFCLL
jgi:hypothetical protein